MASRDVATISSNLSALNISKTNTLTAAYMKHAEPWRELPPEYRHTRQNPRPQFSYGLGVNCIEDFTELALLLIPEITTDINEDRVWCPGVVMDYFDSICKLPKDTIEIHGTYSKEADYVLSLGNTHDDVDLQRCVKNGEKFEAELQRVEWRNLVLKWYITEEDINLKKDWSTPRQ